MFSFIYNDQYHTNTDTKYLANLGLDEEQIESVQRDSEYYKIHQLQQRKIQQEHMVANTDNMVQAYDEQKKLSVKTDITEQQYKQILQFRESLRKMK